MRYRPGFRTQPQMCLDSDRHKVASSCSSRLIIALRQARYSAVPEVQQQCYIMYTKRMLPLLHVVVLSETNSHCITDVETQLSLRTESGETCAPSDPGKHLNAVQRLARGDVTHSEIINKDLD